MDRGIQSYEIAQWTTSEPDGSGGFIFTDHTAIASVHYYERNIVKVVSPPAAVPALSSPMLVVLGAALVALSARLLRAPGRAARGM